MQIAVQFRSIFLGFVAAGYRDDTFDCHGAKLRLIMHNTFYLVAHRKKQQVCQTYAINRGTNAVAIPPPSLMDRLDFASHE